jgi:hypothetical protein
MSRPSASGDDACSRIGRCKSSLENPKLGRLTAVTRVSGKAMNLEDPAGNQSALASKHGERPAGEAHSAARAGALENSASTSARSR